eukprot:GHVS01085801.1.p1 GENE.GHVS01085801.1~~GHVS01085801.1.p1  ORF type:complete len:494 (+),score=16.41 GHVS01085801.1:109-1590(+)
MLEKVRCVDIATLRETHSIMKSCAMEEDQIERSEDNLHCALESLEAYLNCHGLFGRALRVGWYNTFRMEVCPPMPQLIPACSCSRTTESPERPQVDANEQELEDMQHGDPAVPRRTSRVTCGGQQQCADRTVAYLVCAGPDFFEHAVARMPLTHRVEGSGHQRVNGEGNMPVTDHSFWGANGLVESGNVMEGSVLHILEEYINGATGRPFQGFDVTLCNLDKPPYIHAQTLGYVGGLTQHVQLETLRQSVAEQRAAEGHQDADAVDDDTERFLEDLRQEKKLKGTSCWGCADPDKLFGVSVHPKYGGWFVFRYLLLFRPRHDEVPSAAESTGPKRETTEHAQQQLDADSEDRSPGVLRDEEPDELSDPLRRSHLGNNVMNGANCSDVKKTDWLQTAPKPLNFLTLQQMKDVLWQFNTEPEIGRWRDAGVSTEHRSLEACDLKSRHDGKPLCPNEPCLQTKLISYSAESYLYFCTRDPRIRRRYFELKRREELR